METATSLLTPQPSIYSFSKRDVFAETGYVPHEGQDALHDATERFRVEIAGRRWGKSLSASEEAIVELLKPNTRGWVVSKTYDLTMKVIREIHHEMVEVMKLTPSKKQMSGPIMLEFPWGSWVEGKSAEHPESLLGEGLDWLIFDECAKCNQSVWEQYLRPTLTDRQGWALFITTPVGYNWVYDLFLRGKDPAHPDWWSNQSPSWDNPHLSKEDIEEARRTMEYAIFMQEYGANFTLTSGQVYKEFDEETHVIPHKELQIPREWPRWTSIDWGYVDPFVRLYITEDEQQRPIIYDEYYKKGQEPSKLVKKLSQEVNRKVTDSDGNKSMVPGWGNKYTPQHDLVTTKYKFNTCDPSRPESRATFAKGGIPCTPVRTPVLEDGLDDVRSLILRDDETPGMFVSSKCVETIKEFNLYKYPDIDDDRSTGNPIDAYNHCLDAFRYWVQYSKRGRLRIIKPGSGVMLG